MNILETSIYLQAMGIDAYVSRRQLPGAATTQRLAIVPSSPVPLPATATPVQMPRIEPASIAAPVVPWRGAPEGRLSPLRFSLAVITCGGWLWLGIGGEVFSAEQLHLVQAIARAMGRLTAGSLAITASRRHWRRNLTGRYNNLQLDQSEDAARSSLAAFIQRRLGRTGVAGWYCWVQTVRESANGSAGRSPAPAHCQHRRHVARSAAEKQAWQDRRLAGTQ